MKKQRKIPKTRNYYYQKNPKFFNELEKLIKEKPKGYQSSLNQTKRYLNDWMVSVIPLLSDSKIYNTATRCYWILNGLTDFPICPICGKSENFRNKNVLDTKKGYQPYCSRSCMQKDPLTTLKKMQTKNGNRKKKCHKKRIKKTKNRIP